MNKHELILKIKEAFTSLNSDAPALDTAWVMGQVEEYVKSLQPAKEVIPLAWANYIERKRNENESDESIMYWADNNFDELSQDEKVQQKFMRAVVNGYKAEPGNR
ncbi:hypothetical protein, partial [Lacticaseibacillus saniviri]|uniref:hypothetical protein n=1 Tax=Lacticaseibacillus saniviri TaxID=931533 RepID=UPI000ABB894C